MTDNEKAATFIGWRKGQEAIDHPIVTPEKQAELKAKFGMYLPAEAPDMSDPRNYMKALEGLPKDYDWAIQRTDGEGRDCTIQRDTTIACGSTAMEALAALYDAEHANPGETRSTGR